MSFQNKINTDIFCIYSEINQPNGLKKQFLFDVIVWFVSQMSWDKKKKKEKNINTHENIVILNSSAFSPYNY